MEIIFKAWKSHLGLRQLNCRTANLLRLSVMTKLLFCIAVYRLCDDIELRGEQSRHTSLLRLARILGQCACWFAARPRGMGMEVIVIEAWKFLLDTKAFFCFDWLG
jgi:hypothetical protein